MNQILENRKSRLFKRKKYIVQFCISFFIIIFIIIYFSWKKYLESNVSKISNTTKKSYNITRLYSNNIKQNIIANDNTVTVIGTIEIPKINISYPIFSEYSDELLKISVCKLYGSDINVVGNLCIIGHNYNNGDFFSDLYKLNINDIINIYNLNSDAVSYSIYKTYEINPDNLDYLSQDTNGKKEITLITCNNSNRETFNY